MRLNALRPAIGSKPVSKRVGRGIGSGLGKTCGRGHKGTKSRSGGGVKPGFEGGQQPLQRRLPKFGFSSRKAKYVEEVNLSELASMSVLVIDIESLKEADIIRDRTKEVKVIKSGQIEKPITTKGLRVTKGAEVAIQQAGGKVEV